jgi:hypothetical protein
VTPVDPIVRILDVVFGLTVALLVSTLVYLDAPGVIAVMMAVLVVCSGLQAWYEFRLNPLPQTEGGGWSGRRLFYAVAFVVSFFVALVYILTAIL